MTAHPSHNTYLSMDASSYDEICSVCGATDTAGSGRLSKPCPGASSGSERYDADYFLRGVESGKSLYTDYRWMPELTVPMAHAIIDYLGIDWGNTILDFGCARGYLVRALREIGYDASGYDPSEWAIHNCDESVREHVSHASIWPSDWVIAKDVLEHVDVPAHTILALMENARVGVFAVVPLADADGCNYVVPEYEKDVTHLHRRPLGTWAAWFMRPGWSVTACYRVPGVKDNYAQYATGNGFITARRL